MLVIYIDGTNDISVNAINHECKMLAGNLHEKKKTGVRLRNDYTN